MTDPTFDPSTWKPTHTVDPAPYGTTRIEDVADVGECQHCGLPYTRCDCPIDDDHCVDCLLTFDLCRCFTDSGRRRRRRSS